MKTEQSSLFDLNQYEHKQPAGDWQQDVTGDDYPSWSQEFSIGDRIGFRIMQRHGDRVFEIVDISDGIGWAYLAAVDGSVKTMLPLCDLRLAPEIESNLGEIPSQNRNIYQINDSISPSQSVEIESNLGEIPSQNRNIYQINDSISPSQSVEIESNTGEIPSQNRNISQINDSISGYGALNQYYCGGTARGTN